MPLSSSGLLKAVIDDYLRWTKLIVDAQTTRNMSVCTIIFVIVWLKFGKIGTYFNLNNKCKYSIYIISIAMIGS